MKVIIVGAGIAGLSAAIGLRRAGHEVIILEKSSMANEIGAAIMAQPNASRVLKKWDFDMERARLVEATRADFTHGSSLETFAAMEYGALQDLYGARFYFSHRVDLHAELKRLATRTEGDGIPAIIELRKEVIGYEPEEGIVILKDGSRLTADLIIGADGVHSESVKAIIGHANPAMSVEMSAFRWLTPSSEILADPESAVLIKNRPGESHYFIDGAGSTVGKRFVCYPVHENQVQNVAFIVPNEGLDAKEDWNVGVDPSVMLELMENYHPAIQALARKAKDVKLYSLHFRNPLSTWRKGRLVVIGDAAHPMPPFQGQAGAQAIEDGAALEVVFSKFTGQRSVPELLEVFENIRRPQASIIQFFSMAGKYDAEKIAESIRPYWTSEKKVPSTPKEYEAHIWGYDVFAASRSEMRRVFAAA